MTLLVLEGLHKHWPGRDLLEGASLQIDPGEMLGLVGANGTGKTTLLRLILGEEPPDAGRLALRKGARVGHVPQRPAFAPGQSARDAVAAGLAELLAAQSEHRRVSEQLLRLEPLAASGGPGRAAEQQRLLAEQDRLHDLIEALGGWHVEHRVAQVLAGVGLDAELADREAATLSGGEQSRVALAAALVGGHDLLLLDEPTNHLDLAGIEWIESYLRTLPGAVLVVSHDRRLLDVAVDAIVELEHGRLARFPGGYTKYVRLREERYLAERRAFDEQQETIRREEAFIRRYMGGQRTAEARGRRTRLERLARLPEPRHDVRAPVLRLPKAGEGGQLVLEARGLAGGHGGRALFAGLDLRLGKGERLGLLGPNGAGKTTLLRVLAGRQPALAGELRPGRGARCGYYDQQTAELDPAGTPLSEIRRDQPLLAEQAARDWLARFLFRGDAIEQPIARLSGGERARLALARLVFGAPSWLALDEPTNHLDLAGRTALEEALSEFDGALVCVSHDRAFLDGLCTHILAFGEPGPDGARPLHLHVGNYSSWRERERGLREEQNAARREAGGPRRAAGGGRPAAPPDAAEPTRGARGGGKSPRNPFHFERLEQRIIALEQELAGLHAEVARPEVCSVPEKLREASRRIAALQEQLAAANHEWEHWE